MDQCLLIRKTPGQTVTAPNADLALRDVQSAPVLGCVVNLKAPAQTPDLLRWTDMIPARKLVHVPIVHDQNDRPVRKVDIRLHRREVGRGVTLGDLHMTPAQQEAHTMNRLAVQFMLAVDVSGPPRCHRYRRSIRSTAAVPPFTIVAMLASTQPPSARISSANSRTCARCRRSTEPRPEAINFFSSTQSDSSSQTRHLLRPVGVISIPTTSIKTATSRSGRNLFDGPAVRSCCCFGGLDYRPLGLKSPSPAAA